MNEDLKRDLAADASLSALVAALQKGPQAQVPPDFTARVMSAVQAVHAAESAWTRQPAASPHPRFRFLPWAAAACLAIGVGLAVVDRVGRSGSAADLAPADAAAQLVASQRADGFFSSSSAAPYLQAFAVATLAKEPARHADALASAVHALLREQNAEGGWANAELSARNVAALHVAMAAGVPAAARAYKRGLRYLRLNGLFEPTAAEFAQAARAADRVLVHGAAF